MPARKICSPSDKSLVYRQDKHSVFSAALLNKNAIPDRPLRTELLVFFDKLSIRDHVRNEVLVVDLRKPDSFHDHILPFHFNRVGHYQIFQYTRVFNKVSISAVLHLLSPQQHHTTKEPISTATRTNFARSFPIMISTVTGTVW